jgi:hypothetical protein
MGLGKDEGNGKAVKISASATAPRVVNRPTWDRSFEVRSRPGLSPL